MARELLILNPAPFVWQHKDKDIPLPFTISKFFFDIDMGMFQIKEGRGGSGAARFPYSYDKITIKVGNGAIEGPFPNEVALLVRLRQLNYPGFIEFVNAMGLISTDANNILAIGTDGLLYVPDGAGGGSTTYISDGVNTTVSGSGTSIDPYQINVSGGSQDLQQTVENGDTFTDGNNNFRILPSELRITNSDGSYSQYYNGGLKQGRVDEVSVSTLEPELLSLASQNRSISVSASETAVPRIIAINKDNGFFGTLNLGFEAAIDNTPRNFIIPFDDDTAAGRQWVINQGYSTGAGTTNLTTTPSPTTVTINSDTGTDAPIAAVDNTNAGVMLPAQKIKLDGIATGATANQSDAITNAAIALKENSANKQNSLSPDGTGAKFLTVDAANNGLQPIDSDLTAISALTTDSFGRGGLTQTSAANYRAYIGAGIGNGTVTSVSSASASRLSIAGTANDPILDVVSAPKLTTARTIGITTGDATSSGSTFDGTANNTNALTLATVNANTGSFGSATQVPQITLDGKGRTTAASNVSIQIAESQVTNLVTDLGLKAPLASPSFTGTPTAPTAVLGTNTTQIATMAALQSAIASMPRTLESVGTFNSTPGVTAAQILTSIAIPAGMVKDLTTLKIKCLLSKTGTTANAFTSFYLNTAPVLTSPTAVMLSTYTIGSTTTTVAPERTFSAEGTTLNGYSATANSATDANISTTTALSTTFNFATTQYYIILAVQLNAADTMLAKYLTIQLSK